jgi:hypothetical protein
VSEESVSAKNNATFGLLPICKKLKVINNEEGGVDYVQKISSSLLNAGIDLGWLCP